MRTSTLIIAALAAGSFAPAVISGQAPPALTDSEIAHVAVTANAIDIEFGEFAASRAVDPKVLAFAKTMVTDHTAVNEQAVALARRLGVTPAENDVSTSLRSTAEPVRHELMNLSGTNFDRAYVEREVAYHQAVLDALDQMLIPQTQNRELRALLQQARTAIAAHLEHAKRLDRGFGNHR